MSLVSIPMNARKALQSNQHLRNGFYPDSFVQTLFGEQTNAILRYRPKQVAQFFAPLSGIPASGGTRDRWRFAFHSSSHVRYLWVMFECAKVYTDGADSDPIAKMLLELADGTDVGTSEFHFGAHPGATPTDVPSEFGTGYALVKSGGVPVTLAANTDYFATFSDVDNARIISVTVYEETLESKTENGYIDSGVPALGPIYDAHTQDLVTKLRTAWKRNAAGLWVWAAHTDSAAPTRSSSSAANWIDQTITTVSAASPGVTLDMNHKRTERRTGVPCKWFIYAKMSAGTGTVRLVGETAGTIATLSPNSSTAAWYSTTLNLEEIEDKFDLHIAGDGAGVLTLYASSLIQYEA